MNALIEQCWTRTNEPLFSVRSPHWEFDRHKFAGLIVQECLDLLWNSLTISADHVGVVDGIEYTGKEILIAAKKHFGVSDESI